MRIIIAAAALLLSGCYTAGQSKPVTTAGAAAGTYEIRVDHGALSSPALVENVLITEGDKVCPNGFTRVSERRHTEGSFGGRAYTIRCQ